jgi:hypothetical protein
MKILEAEFMKGFIRMANDGWEMGWHERNGGNLSYRIKKRRAGSGLGRTILLRGVEAHRDCC